MAPYTGNYTSDALIRLEGVTIAQASEAEVEAAIKSAEWQIESWANRWFYRRAAYTMVLDGGDHLYSYGFEAEGEQSLWLSVPIIMLTAININGTARTLTNFTPLNRIGPPKDDRYNPRILSRSHEFPRDGVMNIALSGDFGFVEETITYTVPGPIVTAATKLAIRNLSIVPMTDPDRELGLNQGRIIQEQIPGYRYRLSEKFGYSGPSYSGDPEIDAIIEEYRYKRFFTAV